MQALTEKAKPKSEVFEEAVKHSAECRTAHDFIDPVIDIIKTVG